MRKSLQAVSLAALALAASVWGTGASSQSLYVATAHRAFIPGQMADSLYLVDPSTAQARYIGAIEMGDGTSVGVAGMAVNPATGILYGVTAGFSGVAALITIDLATARAKAIGPLGQAASDISFDRQGRLYAWLSDRKQIGSVDLATGAATPLGSPVAEAEPTGGGLAIDDRNVAHISAGTAVGALQSIRLEGMESAVGPIMSGAPYLSSIISLAFSANGRLYGVNSNLAVPSKSALVVINRDTGAVTKIGDLPTDSDALAFSLQPVPPAPAQDRSLLRSAEIGGVGFAAGILATLAATLWHRSRAKNASFATLAWAMLFASIACRAEPGLAGRWAAYGSDDRKRAVVEIVDRGEQATGRIVELFPRPGEDLDPTCVDCAGEARGRRIRGLEILHLRRDTGAMRWHGTVLDPEEGRLYRCTVTLSADGRTLSLRGFMGLPLLGRTDSWARID